MMAPPSADTGNREWEAGGSAVGEAVDTRTTEARSRRRHLQRRGCIRPAHFCPSTGLRLKPCVVIPCDIPGSQGSYT